MNYEVRKTLLTGRLRVHYRCPQCKAELNAAIEEAGRKDACPECGAGYVVPGIKELEEQKQAAQAELDRQVEVHRAEQLAKAQQAEREAVRWAEYQKVLADQRSQQGNADARKPDRAAPQTNQRAADTALVGVLGIFLLLLGVVCLLIGTFMSTTNGDVHNVGLLSTKLATIIAGSGFFVSGCIGIAANAVGLEIQRSVHELRQHKAADRE